MADGPTISADWRWGDWLMRRVVIALVVLVMLTVGFVGVGAADVSASEEDEEFRLEVENQDTEDVEIVYTGLVDEIELEEDTDYYFRAYEYDSVLDEWDYVPTPADTGGDGYWGVHPQGEIPSEISELDRVFQEPGDGAWFLQNMELENPEPSV